MPDLWVHQANPCLGAGGGLKSPSGNVSLSLCRSSSRHLPDLPTPPWTCRPRGSCCPLLPSAFLPSSFPPANPSSSCRGQRHEQVPQPSPEGPCPGPLLPSSLPIHVGSLSLFQGHMSSSTHSPLETSYTGRDHESHHGPGKATCHLPCVLTPHAPHTLA